MAWASAAEEAGRASVAVLQPAAAAGRLEERLQPEEEQLLLPMLGDASCQSQEPQRPQLDSLGQVWPVGGRAAAEASAVDTEEASAAEAPALAEASWGQRAAAAGAAETASEAAEGERASLLLAVLLVVRLAVLGVGGLLAVVLHRLLPMLQCWLRG